jgi:hydrogenase maturation protein HypF
MQTYHIHISGRVQGVGFRPFVCKLAALLKLTGTVTNNTDGLHIFFNAEKEGAEIFYKELLLHPPANAIISNCTIEKKLLNPFSGFTITHSRSDSIPDLLITPDIALCDDCRNELTDPNNKRKDYPFTTCLNCGPRYSIIKSIPYDRHNTSMADFVMCDSCTQEYNSMHDRRHFSQTNSCPDCAISLFLYDRPQTDPMKDQPEIINKLLDALASGKIAAVKGIGGYLLLCDATNEETIQHLRRRKYRPWKPFAVMYPDAERASQDLFIDERESKALSSKVAPIVLCAIKEKNDTALCISLIAPHLDKIGIMLPYTPLLQLICNRFEKPLVATSANISGSPIIYTDETALNSLWDVADLVITCNREIVTPQDDSVWQFNKKGQRIVLRRSRGMAPDYYPHNLGSTNEVLLAMGADMKSAFGVHYHNNIYISQFLGDQGDYLAQQSYTETLDHLLNLFNIRPTTILTDAHPAYYTSMEGKDMSIMEDIPLEIFQHHKAHFAAVLSENNLLETDGAVLGFIWDGTGYGDDHQIWGGEVFRYEKGDMDRILYLDYFPQLLGDKMSQEPRLSAISLLKDHPKLPELMSQNFSIQEWDYYQKLLQKEDNLLTSSMGRLIDGIAAILGICRINTYEGQAAMELEVMAREYKSVVQETYQLPIRYNRIDWRTMIDEMISDMIAQKEKGFMAKKFYHSLVRLMEQVSHIFDINLLAFSGGVFQNALLTEIIEDGLSESKALYFHQQLSPNDECIALGQLSLYHLQHAKEIIHSDSANHVSKQTN